MKMSESTDKIFKALFAAKAEMVPVIKGSVNPHFKSTFANLNDHLDMVEPILQRHGLMVLQPPSSTINGTASVVTLLIHSESGQWLSSELPLTLASDMQKTLAGITYARRGALNAFFSLKAEDDDGETTVGRGKSTAPKQQASSNLPKVETVPLKASAPANKAEVKGFTRQAAKAEVESKPAPVSNGAAKKGVIF